MPRPRKDKEHSLKGSIFLPKAQNLNSTFHTITPDILNYYYKVVKNAGMIPDPDIPPTPEELAEMVAPIIYPIGFVIFCLSPLPGQHILVDTHIYHVMWMNCQWEYIYNPGNPNNDPVSISLCEEPTPHGATWDENDPFIGDIMGNNAHAHDVIASTEGHILTVAEMPSHIHESGTYPCGFEVLGYGLNNSLGFENRVMITSQGGYTTFPAGDNGSHFHDIDCVTEFEQMNYKNMRLYAYKRIG